MGRFAINSNDFTYNKQLKTITMLNTMLNNPEYEYLIDAKISSLKKDIQNLKKEIKDLKQRESELREEILIKLPPCENPYHISDIFYFGRCNVCLKTNKPKK